jgi:hypothetical protein
MVQEVKGIFNRIEFYGEDRCYNGSSRFSLPIDPHLPYLAPTPGVYIAFYITALFTTESLAPSRAGRRSALVLVA